MGNNKTARKRKASLRKDRIARSSDPVIQGLYEVLLRPLMAQEPSGWEGGDWISYLFGVDHRAINHFRSRASFSMPGAVMLTPLIESHSVSSDDRKVKRNDLLCIRYDVLEPDQIDVELIIDPTSPDENTRLFRLTLKQYEEIKHHFVSSH